MKKLILILFLATSLFGQYTNYNNWNAWVNKLKNLVPRDNLVLFVNPGAQMIDGARGNKKYPALQIEQEQVQNSDFHDFTIDYPSIGEPDPHYESDFSAGTDDWGASNGTIVGNVDGIGGEDDVLKFWANGSNSNHFPYTYSSINQTRVPPHTIVRVTGKVFIPSGQTNVDGLRIGTTKGVITQEVKIGTTDTWVDFDAEINNNTDNYAIIRFYETTGGTAFNNIFTGADNSNDDIIYLKDVKFQWVGLVAWWQFDSYYHAQEGTGKTILQDLSGNGYDLTASTGFDWQNQLTGDDPVYKNGNALEFDGVDDRFSNEGSAFQPGSSNFSALVWFKTSEPAGAYHVLMETYDGAGANWQLMIDPSDADLRITITDGTNTQTLLGDPVNDNNWHLGILVRDGNTFYLYDNATVVASWTGTMGSLSNTNELSIGMRNGGTLGFVGNIVTAAYFNRALSATEVKALYGKPKYWTWNETGSITNNNFKAVLSGGAELTQDITIDEETLYKEQKISTTDNDVDYFGNTTSHTVTIGDGTWSYAGVKDVTNVDAVGSNFVEDFSKGGAVYVVVDNSTFETGIDGWAPNARSTIEQSSDDKHSGNSSLKVICITDGYFYSFKEWSVPEGQLIKLDWWQTGDSKQVYTYDGSAYSNISSYFNIYETVGNWKHYSGVYRVETGIIKIRLESGSISGVVGDEVYIDDVIVKQISNGNHGLAKGGLETNQPVHPYAWEFDGVDDFVDFGDVLPIGNGDFLAAFWLKKDAPPSADQGIISTRNGGDWDGYDIRVNTFGQIYFTIDNGSATSGLVTTAMENICDGSWHFVSCVWHNNTATSEIYIDTELDNNRSFSGFENTTINNSGNLNIGRRSSGTAYFQGQIAPVTIYPFDGQDGRSSTMPQDYYSRYIEKIYLDTKNYFQN